MLQQMRAPLCAGSVPYEAKGGLHRRAALSVLRLVTRRSYASFAPYLHLHDRHHRRNGHWTHLACNARSDPGDFPRIAGSGSRLGGGVIDSLRRDAIPLRAHHWQPF